MVKDETCIGFGVTYRSIKDLELGSCDSCIRSRMHAFSLPPSISHKEYRPVECISCDYIPFNRVINGQVKSYSVRGYTGCIIYVDAVTDILWIYLVFNKGEWLSTLQRLIRDYHLAEMTRKSRLEVFRRLKVYYPRFGSSVARHGNTPLHLAAGYTDNVAMIWELVQLHPPPAVEVVNKEGKFPLQVAVVIYSKSAEVVRELAAQLFYYPAAALEIKDKYGQTPLHYPCHESTPKASRCYWVRRRRQL